MFSGFQWSGFDGRAHRWMLLFSYVFDILWQWQVWMVWRSCSFIIHLCSRRVVEHVDAVSNCRFLHRFAKFCIREIHMSGLNVMCSPDFSDHDLNGRALDEDASLDLSLFPGLGRGAEDKRLRHGHRFGIQPDWCRGGQGLVCGMGSAECCGMSWCHFPILSRHPVTVTSLDGLEVL